MRRISSSYCSVKDFLHRITEGTNKRAAKVQQRKGIITDITIKQFFFFVFFLVNDKNEKKRPPDFDCFAHVKLTLSFNFLDQ